MSHPTPTPLAPDAILAPFTPTQPTKYRFIEHVEAWRDAWGQTQEGMFKLSAVAASLVTTYGEREVQSFASEVGVSTALIYERAATFKRMQDKAVEILPVLTYTHHQIAAKTDEPNVWLAKAADEGWSTRKMEAMVKGEAYTPHEPGPYPLPVYEVSRRLENWKSHVRAQPCLVCGARGQTHYAHFKALVNVKTGERESRKEGLSDWLGVPLCPLHHLDGHDAIHAVGEEAFWVQHFGGFDVLMGIYTRSLLEWIARME